MQGRLIERKGKGTAVETRLFSDLAEGKIHFLHTQDCEPIIDAVRDAPEIFKRNPSGAGRYAGTIPLTVAQVWAKEWNVRLFSSEWIKLARKRLDDPEYAYLKVNYK